MRDEGTVVVTILNTKEQGEWCESGMPLLCIALYVEGHPNAQILTEPPISPFCITTMFFP